MRERSIDACLLLNDIWHDLRIVDEIAEHFEQPGTIPSDVEDVVHIARVCFHSHVVVISRLRELVDAYAPYIPASMVKDVRRFRTEFDERHVKAYRDQIVGHIHRRSTGRPVDRLSMVRASWEVTKGSAESFHRWIRDKRAPDSEWSVQRFVRHLQGAIMFEQSLTVGDLGLREAKRPEG